MLQEQHKFADYQIIKRLGQGGMAEVYLAKSEGIGGFERLLALKVIHPHLSSDREFVQMLIDEAKLSVQLTHSNIVQIHDLGEYEGIYYIAMEFIDGQDLYQALVKCEDLNISIPQEIAVFIAIETCAGLHYAHNKVDKYGRPLNIIHRDISPQNILISYDGAIKLVDFGIAKANERNSNTQQGMLKGKYYYMAPEQAWGDPIDARTDLFSVGICLYETLAGEMLYNEDDGLKLLEQVRRADVPSLRHIRPDVFPELEHIIRKSLSAEPYQRFQSAQEMGQVLSEFLHRNWPQFNRQNIVQFMQGIFGERQILLPLNTTTEQVVVSKEALEDHQEQTRAISAHLLAQISHETAHISLPDLDAYPDPLSGNEEEKTRAINISMMNDLHTSPTPNDYDFAQEEKTRAISATMYESLQKNATARMSHQLASTITLDHIQSSHFETSQEEKTRAVSVSDFASVIHSPLPSTIPNPNPNPNPNPHPQEVRELPSVTPSLSYVSSHPPSDSSQNHQKRASDLSNRKKMTLADQGTHYPDDLNSSFNIPDPSPRQPLQADIQKIPDRTPRVVPELHDTLRNHYKIDPVQNKNLVLEDLVTSKEQEEQSALEKKNAKKNAKKRTKKESTQPKKTKEKSSKTKNKSTRVRQKSFITKVIYLIGLLIFTGLLVTLLLPRLMKDSIPDFISMSVSSVPSPAKIFIDGRDIGQSTPAELSKIYLDRNYEITLKKNGHESQSKTFNYKKDQWSKTRIYQKKFFLESSPGELTVTSSPSSARVFYKNKFLGTTPLVKKDMPREEGELLLIVKHRNFKDPKTMIFSWDNQIKINLFTRFSK